MSNLRVRDDPGVMVGQAGFSLSAGCRLVIGFVPRRAEVVKTDRNAGGVLFTLASSMDCYRRGGK